jgi:hypothetical protein
MTAINVISPYKQHGMWVFDDNRDATRSPAWRQHHRDQSALAVIVLSDLGHQFGGLFFLMIGRKAPKRDGCHGSP